MDSIAFWYGLPAIYLLAFMLAALFRTRSWPIAQTGAAVGLGVAMASLVGSLLPFGFPHHRIDPLGLVMASLVALLGWVIVRYSEPYLQGEEKQDRYVAALLFTLASVSTLVLTHNLGVLVAAWTASSLSLHPLLTFHDERAPAQIVAHKKFIASRMAEICLLAALVLLYRGANTLSVDGLAAFVTHAGALPRSFHLAAALIALAAILKSAQLPVHGWLIQVMEAPTPVSALQHAGIVNIGGFVVIRLAALMAEAPAARALLVVVGSLTAVLAGLVMMTRISIKVRLAWSTCAQMGFMLMECGLGLYDLAMLHLVAHSLYKAHAFLSAGETVIEARRHDLAPAMPSQPPSRRVLERLVAMPVALALVAASAAAWSLVPDFHVPPIVIAILGFGLAPLLWGANGMRGLARGFGRILVLTQLYMLWHLGFSLLVPTYGAPSHVLSGWVGIWFLALYVVQIWVLAFPQGALSTRLFPWAYSGFYLDERFTRLTFRIWPARVSVPRSRVRAHPRPSMSGKHV